MGVHAAILRAINVGGTGKLPMTELKRICEDAGFTRVKTYIQSGNVVFASSLSEAEVRGALEKALKAHFGKDFGVFVRSPAQLRMLVEQNPFSGRPGNQVAVIFLDSAPTPAEMEKIVAPGGEAVEPGDRAAYVFYPEGMGRSKLKMPFAAKGTSRNMNTVAKLADMGEETDSG